MYVGVPRWLFLWYVGFVKMCIYISFLFCALSVPALASPEVVALIKDGSYVQATAQAEALQSAEGYAMAAESLNAQILLGEVDDIIDEAKRSRDFASRALAIDPKSYNARLQYALADGFITRSTGTLTAWRKKLPAKTLAIATALHDDFPDDPRGSALLGAWHLGVIRKTGEKNGNKWFGASTAEGRRLYDLAREIAPNDILIATNYAAAILVLDEDLYAEEVRVMLTEVAEMTPEFDAERKIQARALAILAKMDDPDEAEDLAKDLLDGEWDN